ncbi:hypothetical protein [Rhizorhabdus dicambivorans]|uniref:Uncharacterized protein n=1 Tax=Rhizorhabdus dicambivorans TaxID=1850238 RepID=A0A2A4FSU5_9SPHN|nr:hypothetical protein [Rhizorhabdus dicambivorans]ATE64644.1 hypothetical protein CMV14_09690 [Rhizorhabdus dicambivorans]PCE40766.1 hypothetical protein COO09_18805 [Rhizorhabdus dicambivorans]
MSRAVNVQATEDHVSQTCHKLGARITAMEPLLSGGTRVVLSTAVERAAVARSYAKKVIEGAVRRYPTRLQGA